jgi:ornithine cyclodeaminase
MRLLCLSAEDLYSALPMEVAVRVVTQAFAAFSSGRADMPLRTSLSVPDQEGTTLVMPCYLPDYGLGAKLVSVFPRNRHVLKPAIQGLVVLLDPETGAPMALVEGTALTAWRTGAASGAASDLLANAEVGEAAVIGAGPQARTQIMAIDCVRSIERIRVYSRTADGVRALVEKLQPHVSATLVPAFSSSEAVRDAGLICTATSSATPVISGDLVAPGTHINAVGSYTEAMQEIDAATVGQATVFVDSREAAGEEAGDLLAAVRAGVTRAQDWTELGRVVTGMAPGRTSSEEVTLFKSVGLAVQDIAVASEALSRARSQGLGREVVL